jgi:hypothetical protein
MNLTRSSLWLSALAIALCYLPIGSFATNTLVTGIIISPEGKLAQDPLDVEILIGNRTVARVQSDEGMFHADLEGKAKPDDQIIVKVHGATFDRGNYWKMRSYEDGKAQSQLSTAQNLRVEVKFTWNFSEKPADMPRRYRDVERLDWGSADPCHLDRSPDLRSGRSGETVVTDEFAKQICAPVAPISNPTKNTLVTGLIDMTWRSNFCDKIMVEIHQGSNCIARTWSSCGLFTISTTFDLLKNSPPPFMESPHSPHLLDKAQKHMDNRPHTIPYSTGKLTLHSPCSVGKEAFTALEGGNKFCSQCQKVVHDMTQLSEAEIKALFIANAGKVCGSIRVQPKPVEEVLPPRVPVRKVRFLKHFAAAASIFFLYHSPQLKAAPKALTSLQATDPEKANGGNETNDAPWKTNTLVTGVIINQDSELVPLSIPIQIFANKKLIAETTSSHGLFSIDLKDKLAPDAVIELIVKEKKEGDGEIQFYGTYGGGKAYSRLGDAQNLNIKITYHFPRMIEGGLGWEDKWDINEIVPEKLPTDSPTKFLADAE